VIEAAHDLFHDHDSGLVFRLRWVEAAHCVVPITTEGETATVPKCRPEVVATILAHYWQATPPSLSSAPREAVQAFLWRPTMALLNKALSISWPIPSFFLSTDLILGQPV
jgi:hypothetical protein